MKSVNVSATTLVQGDIIDLEGNQYAKCACGGGCNTALLYDYARVEVVVEETPECTVIYTDLATFGCPPDAAVTKMID